METSIVRPKRKSIIPEWLSQSPALSALIILLLLILVSSILSPAFLTQKNITNLLRQMVPLGIVALGQVMVMVAGGVDLSVSSTITLSCIVTCSMMANSNAMILPVILLCLVMGAVIGIFNGFIINKLRVVPFMATLGTMVILEGLGLIITNGAPATNVTPFFRQLFGIGYFLGIPTPVIMYGVLFGLLALIFYRGAFGRYIFAVGGNERASRISGINVERIRIITYILSGMLAALAGVILAARTGSADNWIGVGYDLNSVAATIMGGTVWGGGIGSMAGAVFGVAIMTLIQNILNLMGSNPYLHESIVGFVIISAVVIIKHK